MPRQSTGRPRGRPRGSGLGIGDDAPRLTIRLPRDLYASLEAFAERYKYHRGDPPLSVCVREMVAFCLKHPGIFRQTDIVQGHGENYRQTESQYYRQTENVPVPLKSSGDVMRQTINVPLHAESMGEIIRQTNNVPTFDTQRYYLGKLCNRRHDYHHTGHSLRYLPSTTRGNCRDCTVEQSREQRQKAERQKR
jgi:hypothetical protein